MSNLNKTILEGAGKLQQELLNHRRYLHQNAEVGFDLPVTKAYVKEQLTKMGYQPQDLQYARLRPRYAHLHDAWRRKTAERARR